MGKKNKKEKKGKGKEKTEQKTEKKAAKRSKKELAEKGEEDIEALIAQFQAEDKKKYEISEEKCDSPSPRSSFSIVAHPDKAELLMFGGEYYTGKKMFVYNDLFSFNTKKHEWTKVSIPNAPPPRSSHQAVTVSSSGGQMWVFGGEFSSHTQSQFYHYKDLWLLHLRDRKWEQIKSPGAPSARSGHRMTVFKKLLLLFGGFHDNTRDYKYFNDLYSFDMDTYQWSSIVPSGTSPCPRSGSVFVSSADLGRVIVYGGYSKESVKKDIDKGTTHVDMFTLIQEKQRDEGPPRWKWQPVKQGAFRPSPRSGLSGLPIVGNKALVFGGVYDEEDDEDIESMFYNDLYLLNLESCKWATIQLRKTVGESKRRRKLKEENVEMGDEVEEQELLEDNEKEQAMEVVQESVENLAISSSPDPEDIFTVTYSDRQEDVTLGDNSTFAVDSRIFWPSARMNAGLAYRDGLLFLYGGIQEDGDKQLTLADFYSLDVNKLDEWSVIAQEDKALQQWEDSDSSDDEKKGATAGTETNKDKNNSSDTDSDEDMEITFDDAPDKRDGEGISDYFQRSKNYWLQKAREFYEEENSSINEKRLLRFAKEICDEACGK